MAPAYALRLWLGMDQTKELFGRLLPKFTYGGCIATDKIVASLQKRGIPQRLIEKTVADFERCVLAVANDEKVNYGIIKACTRVGARQSTFDVDKFIAILVARGLREATARRHVEKTLQHFREELPKRGVSYSSAHEMN